MSKWVKIILMHDSSSYDDGDHYSNSVIREGISDWEEISDDEYDLLRNNIYRLFPSTSLHGPNAKPVLLVKDDKPVINRIESIKEIIRKHEAAEKKRQAEAEKKKEERAKKKLLKTATNEIELLKQLQEKYGSATADPDMAVKKIMKASKAKTV